MARFMHTTLAFVSYTSMRIEPAPVEKVDNGAEDGTAECLIETTGSQSYRVAQ